MGNLAWIDIETTGLRPDLDAVLEVGIVITDRRLKILNEINWVCLPSREVPLFDVAPYVLKMHSNSRLWAESSESGFTFAHVADMAKEFMEANDALDSPACGSSVHFDRSFLKAQAKELDKAFHYRNIDVSTMKNLVEMYHPEIFERRPQGEKIHRAIADCLDSIAELKYYVDVLEWELP